MTSKSWYSPVERLRANKPARSVRMFCRSVKGLLFTFICFVAGGSTLAGDAPAWMHAAAVAPLPAHDEKTDAVIIYSEDITTVLSEGKVKTLQRRAYKILRPGGKEYGRAVGEFDSNSKISGMRAWCIPVQGKDYEIKDKDAIEVSPAGVEEMVMATDAKYRVLKIPAAEPGNIVGYEIEREQKPYILQDWWDFQERVPTREARYTLQLPQGWEYKAVWINHQDVQPTSAGPNQWQWVVTDVAGIKEERYMPPWREVASQMLLSFLPPGRSGKKGFENWTEMGRWEAGLDQGRRDASPEIKQKVAELTAGSATTLAKMQVLSNYVQKDIRYVAIELGLGGWQPHAAKDVYAHRYGDCKDKATLMGAMLKEVGVESYYLSINTTRGGVTATTPPQMYWFNHEIIGIRLPEEVKDPSLLAVFQHPTLGKILIFDPTDEITPLGQIRGELQSNYGLLVTPGGGDLILLPQLQPSASGTRRVAKLSFTEGGRLSGDVTEVRRGDSALYQRMELRSVTKEADRIKPIETTLSHSLGNFKITKATIGNLNVHDLPLQWNYSFTTEQYAKTAGNLLLLRPRVFGSYFNDILEQKELRKYPVEFEGPALDSDIFEIEIPAGYEVDDLPAPADVDYSFASYHSKAEMKGNLLIYTRSFEIKELSVPVEKLGQLKTLYRTIGSDERSTAVLKPKGN